MNYYIATTTNINNFEIEKIENKIKDGIFSVYSLSHQKFYHIFRAKTGKITYSWRRGLSLKFLPDMAFIQKLSKDSIKQIRRKDFIKLYYALKKIQEKKSSLIHLHIDDKNLFLLNASGNMPYFSKLNLFFRKTELISVCNKILQGLEHDILNGSENLKTTLYLINAIKKKITGHLALQRTLKSHNNIIISSDSLAYLTASFFLFFYEIPVVFALASKNFETRFINREHKIRRVLVINNLNGKPLKNLRQLNLNKDILNSVKVKEISGLFDKKRLTSLFENNNDGFFDLIIYRGHAEVCGKRIAWPLKDGKFYLKSNSFKYCIHLACLPISVDNQILELPFLNGVIPFSYIPDIDYTFLIEMFFINLNKYNAFIPSWLETLRKNKKMLKYFGLFIH